MPIAIECPVLKLAFCKKLPDVRYVFEDLEIFEIAGFWILSASFLNSAISTVRPVFFCGKCQIRWENAKKYRTYSTFWRATGKSTVCTVLFGSFAKESTVRTVLFGTKKMAKISVIFAN